VPSIVIYTRDSENFSFSTTIRSYADCAVYLAVQENCRFPDSSVWSRAGSRLCSDLSLFNSYSALVANMYQFELSFTNFSAKEKKTFLESSLHFAGNSGIFDGDSGCGMIGRIEYARSVHQEFGQSALEWSKLLLGFNKVSTSGGM
jgi:hypothetical protein